MNKWQFNNATLVALVAGLVVGLTLGFSINTGKQTGDGTPVASGGLAESPSESNLAATGGVAGEPLITRESRFKVVDQDAGSRVQVSDIALNQVSWLAVREENGGQWGNILGAKRLPAGFAAEATIELLRPTQAGGNYFVVLYEDDGDLAFDYQVDSVLLVGGQPVETTFTAL